MFFLLIHNIWKIVDLAFSSVQLDLPLEQNYRMWRKTPSFREPSEGSSCVVMPVVCVSMWFAGDYIVGQIMPDWCASMWWSTEYLLVWSMFLWQYLLTLLLLITVQICKGKPISKHCNVWNAQTRLSVNLSSVNISGTEGKLTHTLWFTHIGGLSAGVCSHASQCSVYVEKPQLLCNIYWEHMRTLTKHKATFPSELNSIYCQWSRIKQDINSI